jgi:hypothetical protein
LPENETPELETVLEEAVRTGMMDLRVALPCRVEKYNKERQEVDLQPLIKKQYRSNDEIVSLPIIPSVPVHFQSSDDGGAFISLPLKVGDLGFCIVCDRSIDKWLSGDGQEVFPDDNRIHNLTDAIFLPGLRPFQNALSGVLEDDILIKNGLAKITLKPDGETISEGGVSKITAPASGDIVIEGGSAKITFDPSGKFSIEGATESLLPVLSDMITNLIGLTVDVIGVTIGPTTIVAPLSAASIANLISDKAKLDSLKI